MSKFHVLIEMTVEFVRSPNEDDDDRVFENEGNFNNASGIMDCHERRNIIEYSATANGVMANRLYVYNGAMSQINHKVHNSFNVTGSDWSLRRIVLSNISLVSDFGNTTLFSPRLAKGKYGGSQPPVPTRTTPPTFPMTVDALEKLFVRCYEKIRDNAVEVMKDQMLVKGISARTKETRRKTTGLILEAPNIYPDLTRQDKRLVKSVTKMCLTSATVGGERVVDDNVTDVDDDSETGKPPHVPVRHSKEIVNKTPTDTKAKRKLEMDEENDLNDFIATLPGGAGKRKKALAVSSCSGTVPLKQQQQQQQQQSRGAIFHPIAHGVAQQQEKGPNYHRGRNYFNLINRSVRFRGILTRRATSTNRMQAKSVVCC